MDTQGTGNPLTRVLSKVLMVVVLIACLMFSIVYLNNRWRKIRDFRRNTDSQTIIKALEYYNQANGKYPATNDNDGEGWDKSNDITDSSFLDPMVNIGLLSIRPFDPVNDVQKYYRYQRFDRGEFGCSRPFVIFQVTDFETTQLDIGKGECPRFNFTELAPNGYTYQAFE